MSYGPAGTYAPVTSIMSGVWEAVKILNAPSPPRPTVNELLTSVSAKKLTFATVGGVETVDGNSVTYPPEGGAIAVAFPIIAAAPAGIWVHVPVATSTRVPRGASEPVAGSQATTPGPLRVSSSRTGDASGWKYKPPVPGGA